MRRFKIDDLLSLWRIRRHIITRPPLVEGADEWVHVTQAASLLGMNAGSPSLRERAVRQRAGLEVQASSSALPAPSGRAIRALRAIGRSPFEAVKNAPNSSIESPLRRNCGKARSSNLRRKTPRKPPPVQSTPRRA